MNRLSCSIVIGLLVCVALAACKPGNKTVPDVAGMTQTAASTAIAGAGLAVGTVTQAYDAVVASGLVVSQSPTAGSSVSSGSAVDFVVSQGPQPVSVPNVVGMMQAAASAAITGAGLTVGSVTSAHSATVAVGAVVSQTPAADMSVAPGTAVDIVVSLGVAPVAVPNVVGQAQSAAQTALVGAGLVVGTVTQVYSETVASGSVISQLPAAGVTVAPGSAVALTVSKGPQPVSVPDVVGMTQAAADTAITSASLALGTVTQTYSATVPTGDVVSQLPAAGTSVPPGTTVNLDVSKGPEPVTVPDVVGLAQAEADTVITSALLALGAVTQMYSDTVSTGDVVSQLPAAGTSVLPGTAVNLDVSKGPEPVIVPDVVGMTQLAADSAITNALLAVGAVTQMYSAAVIYGSVISQSPVAGTPVIPGSGVDLTVSKGAPPVSVIALPGGIQMQLVQIAGGTFTMGSPDTEKDRYTNEGPQQKVTLDGFWMGQYLVTQAQWLAVMGSNPSHFTGDPVRPVEQLSWYDCQAFITALNAHIAATSQGPATFRLPTEAEWEFACRAGTTTRFYWGDDLDYAALGDYAWYEGNSGEQTHKVGLLLPNDWSLYDMCGNVWEWCQDWYGLYTGDTQSNPTGPSTGTQHVIRGGAWLDDGTYCRSAVRLGDNPSPTDYIIAIGLRVSRS